MKTRIDIQGDPASVIGGLKATSNTAYRRAMRHAAYNSMLLIRSFMRKGSNGVEQLPPITDMQRTRRLDAFKGKKLKGGYPRSWREKYGFDGKKGDWRMFGKLIQTLKYRAKMKARDFVAQVGWFDKSSARLAAFFQKGDNVLITDKMRALFHKAGMHIKRSKTHIVVPERQVITPFFTKYRGWIIKEFNQRYAQNIHQEWASILRRANRKFTA